MARLSAAQIRAAFSALAGDDVDIEDASVPPAPARLFLVRAAETMPRLRRSCLEEGPWSLRRRGLLAPPDFLTQA